MPAGFWNREWLNANSQRAYPLTEWATKTSGTFRIPDDFILGLYFPVHAGLNVQTSKFYISRITVFSTGFNIALSYDDGTVSPPVVATAVIARGSHTEYASYAMPGKDDFDDSVGKIVIGKLSTIDALPAGDYLFDLEDGAVEVDSIRPMISDVRGIVAVNGSDRSERMYGDIELIAGQNILLTPIIVTGQDPIIRIDAVEGEGLTEDCICADELSPPIRTINGIPPTSTGDFTLLGDECIELQSISNGIRLLDICSAPCCGCEELEALTQELEVLGNAQITARNFLSNLSKQVETMSQVVLGSVLRDDGCYTCDV
jgi:hypothetical protein